jgi:hypothetical protein
MTDLDIKKCSIGYLGKRLKHEMDLFIKNQYLP